MIRSTSIGLSLLLALAASTSHAAVAYDLESAGLDGFGPNGGGVTVTPDSIGATNGPTSMKIEVVEGATFVGALTPVITPPIGDPPGVESIVFDLTITEEFTGGFAAIGVTIFGATQPDFLPAQLFGLQAQFADFTSVDGVAPGTYEITLDLDSATNPITFAAGESFNEIVGGFGTGPDDLIPTGFQLFLNKSNDAPLTVYIDNIRTVVPEPMSAILAAAAGIGVALSRRR